MSRLHHFLFLSLIGACIAYPLLTHQPAIESPPEEANEAAPPRATPPPVDPEQAVRDDRNMKASVDALARMETDAARRARTASKTYQDRTELSTKAQSAWSAMIATNTPIYLTLHRAASQDEHHETPCTICDSKGYMHYCILCESSKGQCVTCQGTGLTATGGDCPVCLGKKKCYLCYGTGKMPCVFCDDGTITLRTINPPKVLPIHCPEPAELLLAEAKAEKEKKSEIMNTVSGWIDQGPSLQQAIQEDQVQLAAEAPPSVWVRQRDELLLMLVCALALPLIIPALRPHDAEAELRELSGKYLVDGKEMAHFNMPTWFAPGALQPAWENHPDNSKNTAETGAPDPVAEFFQLAPQRLAAIQALFKELDLTGALEKRQETLLKAHGLICELKEKSTNLELRPAWQLISALELLVKRIADKPKDLTTSILRTFATGIDMLLARTAPLAEEAAADTQMITGEAAAGTQLIPAEAQTVISPPSAHDEESTRAHADFLHHLEVETKKFNDAAAETYAARAELTINTHAAWNAVISTNAEAYRILHKMACESHDGESLCTICDSTGYMHFCVLCQNNGGKCLSCGGSGRSQAGRLCPACLGKKKCFLCYGTGRMPCLFCDDGTVTRTLIDPPTRMPLMCPSPAEAQMVEIRKEKENQSRSADAASVWMENRPSIQQVIQAIQAERAQTSSTTPATYVKSGSEWFWICLICSLAAALGIAFTFKILHGRKAKPKAQGRMKKQPA